MSRAVGKSERHCPRLDTVQITLQNMNEPRTSSALLDASPALQGCRSHLGRFATQSAKGIRQKRIREKRTPKDRACGPVSLKQGATYQRAIDWKHRAWIGRSRVVDHTWVASRPNLQRGNGKSKIGSIERLKTGPAARVLSINVLRTMGY